MYHGSYFLECPHLGINILPKYMKLGIMLSSMALWSLGFCKLCFTLRLGNPEDMRLCLFPVGSQVDQALLI